MSKFEKKCMDYIKAESSPISSYKKTWTNSYIRHVSTKHNFGPTIYAKLPLHLLSNIWNQIDRYTSVQCLQQPLIPLQTDNKTEVGISNDTIEKKFTKVLDMRWHRIKYQIQLKQYDIYIKPGSQNKAYFFSRITHLHIVENIG